MELCGQTTLSQYCRSRPLRRLGDSEAFKVFYPLLQAVQYLHSQGIAHRDIKLTNVLVDNHGGIKLIDFGFADSTSRILRAYCGTPSYMAPELMAKREYWGRCVDMWALGVVLYRLLTGEYAFGAEDDPDLQRRAGKGQPISWEGIGQGPREILEKCWQIEPEARGNVQTLLAMGWVKGHLVAKGQPA